MAALVTVSTAVATTTAGVPPYPRVRRIGAAFAATEVIGIAMTIVAALFLRSHRLGISRSEVPDALDLGEGTSEFPGSQRHWLLTSSYAGGAVADRFAALR